MSETTPGYPWTEEDRDAIWSCQHPYTPDECLECHWTQTVLDALAPRVAEIVERERRAAKVEALREAVDVVTDVGLDDPPPDLRACPTCGDLAHVTEEHDEEIGYEERARPVLVLELSCGHSIELPSTWKATR